MKKKYEYPSAEVTELSLLLPLLSTSGGGGGSLSDPDDDYKDITRLESVPEGGRLC